MTAPAVAAVASADNNSVNYSVSVPAGTVDGDLLVGVVASDWGTDAGNAFPAAWGKLATSSYSAGTNAFHVALYTRVAASEPATYTVAHDGSGSVAAILRVTGWDSTAGLAGAVKEVAPSTTGTGTTAPSIVPFGVDDLLLTFHGAEITGSGARTWTPPSGMTEDVDRQSTVWTSLEVNHLANPSNPSGAMVATPSASVDTGAACTISIKAAGSGAGMAIDGHTLTYHMNRKAATIVNGVPTLTAQGAANVWAGTVGLELVHALNVKAGNTLPNFRELAGVLNQLAGTTGLEVDGAASNIP